MSQKPEKNNYISDKKIHRSFQIGALLLVIYVMYNVYFEVGSNGIVSPSDARYMSDEEINAKVKETLEKVTNEPEYKQIKDFVSYIEGNVIPTEPKILDAKNGILIFVPADKIKNDNSFEVKSETINININSKKLPVVEEKDADKVESSKIKTDK